MLRAACVNLCLLALTLACSSAPMPEGIGRGILAHDPTAPPGAEVCERPEPVVGTRYALLRGGQQRQDYVVSAVDDRGFVVADAAGHQLRRDRDLGYLGEWDQEGEPVQLFAPADARYHWPLWVGKRWRCEYVTLRPGVPVHKVRVSYRVEDMDRIEVEAGTFDALRILRVATLVTDEGTYLDQTSVCWYAPSIGFEVRQVIDGVAHELLEWTVPGR